MATVFVTSSPEDMQNLRNADDCMVIEGLRSTRKWKVL
jgi:hypothetical protein